MRHGENEVRLQALHNILISSKALLKCIFFVGSQGNPSLEVTEYPLAHKLFDVIHIFLPQNYETSETLVYFTKRFTCV